MGNYDFELDLETQNTMSVINQWITPYSAILEFGPANGRLTKYLYQNKKCNITIVELEEESGKEAAQYASKSFLGEEYGNIEKYFWTEVEERFDYIIFADVLEHLRDPKKALIRCREFLKSEGKILVSIPNVAHNSVIINLLKDEFEYDDAGLLDRTHVHFFTHKSFVRMVQECGLSICSMVPIYSRVSENEIDNSYTDIPVEVASYLRMRPEGSVYQYVFCLSEKAEDAVWEEEEIKALEVDVHETLETQIFYKESEEASYQNEKRMSKTYAENEQTVFEIDLKKIGESQILRWDPLEYNGLVWLEQCFVFGKRQVYFPRVNKMNAVGKCGKLFLFKDADPWIEFEKIPKELKDGKFVLSFRILKYRKEEKYIENTMQFLRSLGLNTDELLEKGYIADLERNIEEQKEYISHLEKDIKEQKVYSIHLEEDGKEQREYARHLERDIETQKEYVRHLEKDIEELKEFIEHKKRKR